jgi:hypothetical protein
MTVKSTLKNPIFFDLSGKPPDISGSFTHKTSTQSPVGVIRYVDPQPPRGSLQEKNIPFSPKSSSQTRDSVFPQTGHL